MSVLSSVFFGFFSLLSRVTVIKHVPQPQNLNVCVYRCMLCSGAGSVLALNDSAANDLLSEHCCM